MYTHVYHLKTRTNVTEHEDAAKAKPTSWRVTLVGGELPGAHHGQVLGWTAGSVAVHPTHSRATDDPEGNAATVQGSSRPHAPKPST